MPTYRVTIAKAGSTIEEDLEAESFEETGPDGAWTDFYDKGHDVILRLRSADVERIERVDR